MKESAEGVIGNAEPYGAVKREPCLGVTRGSRLRTGGQKYPDNALLRTADLDKTLKMQALLTVQTTVCCLF